MRSWRRLALYSGLAVVAIGLMVLLVFHFIYSASTLVNWVGELVPDSEDRLPITWNQRVIEKSARAAAGFDDASSCEIIAWKIEEDDRSSRVEECIVWLYAKSESKEDFAIVRLRRDGSSDMWSNFVAVSGPIRSGPRPRLRPRQMAYPYAPTLKELRDFLSETGWSFDARGDCRVIDTATRRNAGFRAFGADISGLKSEFRGPPGGPVY